MRYYWLYAIAIFLLSEPIVALTSYVMSQLPVPGFLSGLESMRIQLEEKTLQILSARGLANRVMVVFTTVVVAPVLEELFFRGAILGWLMSRTRRVHLSVWVIAFVFGVIHGDWVGVLPRLIMGALLGYVAVYGGLWSAIALHVVNNLAVVLQFWATGNMEWPQTLTATSLAVFVVVSIVATAGLVWLIQRMRGRLLQESEPMEIE